MRPQDDLPFCSFVQKKQGVAIQLLGQLRATVPHRRVHFSEKSSFAAGRAERRALEALWCPNGTETPGWGGTANGSGSGSGGRGRSLDGWPGSALAGSVEQETRSATHRLTGPCADRSPPGAVECRPGRTAWSGFGPSGPGEARRRASRTGVPTGSLGTSRSIGRTGVGPR
jgi:hypothetical protein